MYIGFLDRDGFGGLLNFVFFKVTFIYACTIKDLLNIDLCDTCIPRRKLRHFGNVSEECGYVQMNCYIC